MERMNPPDPERWAPRSPQELATRLRGVDRPWCIVGGWALDLWLGRQSRPHSELEFTIIRQDLGAFRHALGDHVLYGVQEGELVFLPPDEPPGAAVELLWCLDRAEQAWRADMMIEPGDEHTWICKCDPSLQFPRADMILRDPEGIPYLRPAAVLLFKAKYSRGKDEADFHRVRPTLPIAERAWLDRHLAKLHPEHAWLASL